MAATFSAPPSTLVTLDDGTRLALGTLTVLPVPPPTQVTPKVAAVAMLMAPFAALPIAAFSAGLVWAGSFLHVNHIFVGIAAVATLGILTRGMHLDGLADAVDGLGSGQSRERALEVMRRGDVGPLGAVALILVLFTQIAAVADIADHDIATAAACLLVTVTGSRIMLSWLCLAGIPAARGDGLGAAVAGSVPRGFGIVAGIAELGALALFSHLVHLPVLQVIAAALAGTLIGAVFALRCIRRFGGITGDVLGATVELTLTAALVGCAVLQ